MESVETVELRLRTGIDRGPQVRHIASLDAKVVHVRKKRRAVHSQASGGAKGATHAPLACSERPYDLIVVPLHTRQQRFKLILFKHVRAKQQGKKRNLSTKRSPRIVRSCSSLRIEGGFGDCPLVNTAHGENNEITVIHSVTMFGAFITTSQS